MNTGCLPIYINLNLNTLNNDRNLPIKWKHFQGNIALRHDIMQKLMVLSQDKYVLLLLLLLLLLLQRPYLPSVGFLLPDITLASSIPALWCIYPIVQRLCARNSDSSPRSTLIGPAEVMCTFLDSISV